MEAYETQGLHTHLVLQFSRQVDKTARSFAFEGLVPNVSQGDYLGEGYEGTAFPGLVESCLRGCFHSCCHPVGLEGAVCTHWRALAKSAALRQRFLPQVARQRLGRQQLRKQLRQTHFDLQPGKEVPWSEQAALPSFC